LVTRAPIAICVNPRLRTRAKPAHPLFGASAGPRKMKPVANLDSIVDVIVRPPFVGTLDHADTVIDDFYAIGSKIGNYSHGGLIYDGSADRRSAQILFDKPENRVPIIGLDGARRESWKVAFG
jgi:hypothetical protein